MVRLQMEDNETSKQVNFKALERVSREVITTGFSMDRQRVDTLVFNYYLIIQNALQVWSNLLEEATTTPPAVLKTKHTDNRKGGGDISTGS